jgi:hypothetical protein
MDRGEAMNKAWLRRERASGRESACPLHYCSRSRLPAAQAASFKRPRLPLLWPNPPYHRVSR